MHMETEKLENYLLTYRKKSELAQRDVAFLLGCASGAKVSKYERFRRIPTLPAVFAYETILGKPARVLFAGMHERIERKTLERVRLLAERLGARQAHPAVTRKVLRLQLLISGAEQRRREPVPHP